VVCLGLGSVRDNRICFPRGAQHGEVPTPGSAEIGFNWRLPTTFLPDAVVDEIEEEMAMLALDGPDAAEWVRNWDPDRGSMAETEGIMVLVSAFLQLTPGEQPAAAEVWEWEYFRVEAKPQLAFTTILERIEESLYYETDHMLRAFLHAAVPCWRCMNGPMLRLASRLSLVVCTT
jgi:hypothetical protein